MLRTHLVILAVLAGLQFAVNAVRLNEDFERNATDDANNAQEARSIEANPVVVNYEKCVPPQSRKQCQTCTHTSQCADSSFCCPLQKVCVKSQGGPCQCCPLDKVCDANRGCWPEYAAKRVCTAPACPGSAGCDSFQGTACTGGPWIEVSVPFGPRTTTILKPNIMECRCSNRNFPKGWLGKSCVSTTGLADETSGWAPRT